MSPAITARTPPSPLPHSPRTVARTPARVRRGVLVLMLWPALSAASACTERRVPADTPYADIVNSAVPKIEEQVGLPFKTPPRLERRTKAEVAKFVMQQLTSEQGKAQIAGQEAVYRRLGLIPDTLRTALLLQRLLEEQIIGYYNPATKVLYVVDGAPAALLQQTVSHELVHALQDQYINMDSVQKLTDDADRQSAAQAVLEGQAVFDGLAIDPNAGTMLKMPGGWDRMRDAIRDGQVGMPVFASAPRAIREGLLFPYLGGADFTRRFLEKNKSQKELLANLPISTRQILNDDAYFDLPRHVPTPVTLPAPRTGKVTFTNTYGEFETRLVLVQHLRDEVMARRGASGVDGDRFEIIDTPGGEAIVWANVWDTTVDAADFFGLMSDAVKKRYDKASDASAPGATVRRFSIPADGARVARTVTLQVVTVSGRPVVLYVDAPASVGGADALVDPARIVLGR